MRRWPAVLILVLTLAIRPGAATPASAAMTASVGMRASVSPARAPNARPLGTGVAGNAEATAAGNAEGTAAGNAGATVAEEASTSSPSSDGEPLAANGLSSPLCRAADAAELPASAARDCRVTGFEAARAPSGDYAFDVHIDTGVTHVGNTVQASFQDLMQLWWTSLVAIVHGLIVLLDWCFTLDLLNSPAMSGLTRGLRATQEAVTRPWLELVLAIAAVIAAYHGLVQRRVAQTLSEALLMLAMMAGGLWVIANPLGTLGALGAWANEASLGTLGAVVAGTVDHPERTLAESNQNVFDAAIDAPWCYLEFGDVSWCENPGRLSPRLRAAALRIAANGGGDAPGASAALVREARTNGALFLALPANGPARNSINEEGSLFHVLCGGSAEPCVGSTAGQAEFRTQNGTIPRAFGLLIISIGLVGMLLVLGTIALRLLGAAFVSLIYLLLTPAAVLAPALGESGRAAFRAWAIRLLGAVVSKLVFSFLLGAVLATGQALAGMRMFGWLTQWLLISALWWTAFVYRHRLLDLAYGERSAEHRSVVGRAHDGLRRTRRAVDDLRWAKHELARPAPSLTRPRARARIGSRERSRQSVDAQALRSLELDRGAARAQVEVAAGAEARLAGKRAQLARVQRAHERANVAGDGRGAAKLGLRAQRIAGAIAHEENALQRAQNTVAAGSRRRTGDRRYTREQLDERAQLLDAQAALPRAGRRGAGGERRDYAALAGLAGYGPAAYEQLHPREQRQARLQIDRELAMRRGLAGASSDAPAGVGTRAEVRVGAGSPARTAGARMDGHMPDGGIGVDGRAPPRRAADRPPSAAESWRRERAAQASPRARRGAAAGAGYSIMDDAREVAARRKRQLGRDEQ